MGTWLQKVGWDRSKLKNFRNELTGIIDNLDDYEPSAGDNRYNVQETGSMLNMVRFFLDSALENMEKIKYKKKEKE